MKINKYKINRLKLKKSRKYKITKKFQMMTNNMNKILLSQKKNLNLIIKMKKKVIKIKKYKNP